MDSSNKSDELILNIEEISRILPHAYPMLLVDKAIIKNNAITGIKCVSMNEWYFQGHFPTKPVMPGVLIVEAMAQTSVILCNHIINDSSESKKIAYLSTIDSAKFRKPVVPGDILHLQIEKTSEKRGFWKFSGDAVVNENIVATAEWGAFVS